MGMVMFSLRKLEKVNFLDEGRSYARRLKKSSPGRKERFRGGSVSSLRKGEVKEREGGVFSQRVLFSKSVPSVSWCVSPIEA